VGALADVYTPSILLGSTQPEVTKAWYKEVFGPAESPMGALDFGGFLLFIESHSEVTGPATDPARWVLNMNVSDARHFESLLKAKKANWVRPLEEMPFGLIGTVTDPDGNYVQVIQWAAAPADH